MEAPLGGPESEAQAPVVVVAQPHELTRLIERCADAPELAVDIESNGFHAYRASLCVLQLAWPQDSSVSVAIIDPAQLDLLPLSDLLGPEGPPKILHDLTFDAQLLRDCGVILGNVRDTAVAARLLGEPATGLAALAKDRLGVVLSKEMQGHDWALRPLTGPQLDYLAGDVRYLFDLANSLWGDAQTSDIGDEIAVECSYRLAAALAAPTARSAKQQGRPAYCRIKGYAALDGLGRSVLARVVASRELLAEAEDCPPFRIAPDGILLELARRRPTSRSAVRAACGRAAGARRHTETWLAAVRGGLDDGPAPAAEERSERPDPRQRTLTRRYRARVNQWRKEEAAERSIDVQAVLPGHCAADLAGAMAAHHEDGPAELGHAVDRIEGLGSARLDRYGQVWLGLAEATRGDIDP